MKIKKHKGYLIDLDTGAFITKIFFYTEKTYSSIGAEQFMQLMKDTPYEIGDIVRDYTKEAKEQHLNFFNVKKPKEEDGDLTEELWVYRTATNYFVHHEWEKPSTYVPYETNKYGVVRVEIGGSSFDFIDFLGVKKSETYKRAETITTKLMREHKDKIFNYTDLIYWLLQDYGVADK